MLNADASGRDIHNRYVPHLTALAAAYDYVHTRARGPNLAPSDANGPVAPADPGRWCVWGHGCSSHAARHHLHRLYLIVPALKAWRPNQVFLIFLHND